MAALKKMDDHPAHTIPNHHPTKKDVLTKNVFQINLAAKWQVRHSSRSSKEAMTFAFTPVFVLLLWLKGRVLY